MQRVALATQVGEDAGPPAVSSGAAARAPRPARSPRRGLRAGPGQLGRSRRTPNPGLAEPLLHRVEEGGVAVVGEFHLDLGPARRRRYRPRAARPGRVVDTQLGRAGPRRRPADGRTSRADTQPDRRVSVRAPRIRGATQCRRGAGGTVSASGARISSRTPGATGSLRCQPASSPPVRRRRVSAVGGEPLVGGVVVDGVELARCPGR